MRVLDRLRRLWRRLRGRPEPVSTLFEPGEPEDRRLDPAERVLPQWLQVQAEDTINADLGLPASWRCPCGGRPFITENRCPRCGRPMAERWA